jgi:hypothetical protein
MYLGPTGAASIPATMFPGSYDISYEPNEACPGTQLPCTGGLLKQSYTVNGDFDDSIDLPVVTASGNITAQGAALVDGATPRGAIGFVSVETGYLHKMDLGATGAGAYTLRVIPGDYDLRYYPPSGGTPGTQLPQVAAVFKKNVAILANTALDIDVPVITVSGAITANGAALTDQPSTRGAITFSQLADGYVPTVKLGISGPMSYTLRVIPGDYDIGYGADSCADGAQLPCGAGVLPHVSLTTSNHDVDIPVIRLSGSVTLNGAPMVDNGAGRGAVSFFIPDQGSLPLTLTATGPATYTGRRMAGTYLVSYSPAGSAYCGPDGLIDENTPPCTGQVVKGCGQP